jgi:hypothetical protein
MMARVYESKKGVVNLDRIVFMEKAFMQNGLKHVIYFQGDNGHKAWQYASEAERDADYAAINAVWKQ